ncbi:MAG TPA: dephospho-CoA kinase [Vicinamibacterales bacterium]|nr:dephospho-CoA kinase [Vicinamibacterales bacterium]
MQHIGLTGGIATGKSHVRSRLQALGIPVVDADAIVHGLLAGGTPATGRIARRFGAGVLRPDGAVDRAALGRLVFADAAARGDLEAILHPAVYARIAQWMEEQEAGGSRAAAADIPLLFETGHERDFDIVVVVACDPAEQVRRVMARDRLSERDARARLAAQWPIEEKVARADHVIRTDGSFAETDLQVEQFARTLAERPDRPA